MHFQKSRFLTDVRNDYMHKSSGMVSKEASILSCVEVCDCEVKRYQLSTAPFDQAQDAEFYVQHK